MILPPAGEPHKILPAPHKILPAPHKAKPDRHNNSHKADLSQSHSKTMPYDGSLGLRTELRTA